MPPEPTPRIRALPPAARTAPGLFYGWIVAVGASLLAFVAVGIGFYGQTVLLDGLVQARGWSPASVSAAVSLYFVVAGLTGPLVGGLVDRFGPRRLIAAGILLMGAGLIWVGRAGSPRELMVAFVVLALGFSMAGSVPGNALVTRWFVAMRARALSVAQTGVSLGGMVLVPLAVWLIERKGIEVATQALAALLVCIALPVTIFVLAGDPRAYGLLPDDGRQAPDHNPLLSADLQGRVWRARDILATRAFWLLALAFSAILFSQMSFLIHQVALMRESVGGTLASFTTTLTAGASVLGRFAGGVIADRSDKRRFGVVLFCVQAIALFLLSRSESAPALFATAGLLGLTIGNIFMLQSLLASELFGVPSFGTAYGLLLLVSQVAGGLGPLCLGLLAQHQGGYAPALAIMAAISVFAALTLSRVRAPLAPAQGRIV